MPDVLIIAEYGTLNGGENSLLAVLPKLASSNRDFHAIVPPSGDFIDRLNDLGVNVTPYDFVSGGKRKPLPQLRAELGERIAAKNPDLVHCNSLSASRIAGPVSRQMSIPSIGYLRDIIKLGPQAIRDLNCLDIIVAVSDATLGWHIGQGVDPCRIRTIHNGIDAEQFPEPSSDNPLRQELQIPAHCPIILFIGQIGMRKGLNTWLNAAAQIRDLIPDAKFVIAGTRHSTKDEAIVYEDELKRQSASSALRGHVFWLGTRNDVPQLMHESTLLMHCARQEPLGRVLLEAFAMGLPTVATDVGGTGEIFCHPDIKSFLVPVDDPAATAEAAARLLNSQPLQESVSRRVRQIACDSFSVQACVSKLNTVYTELTTAK